MGTSNYSDEFKHDAVHQITVRGYSVREVSRRLGVSTYSLYKWLMLFGEPSLIKGVYSVHGHNRDQCTMTPVFGPVVQSPIKLVFRDHIVLPARYVSKTSVPLATLFVELIDIQGLACG